MTTPEKPSEIMPEVIYAGAKDCCYSSVWFDFPHAHNDFPAVKYIRADLAAPYNLPFSDKPLSAWSRIYAAISTDPAYDRDREAVNIAITTRAAHRDTGAVKEKLNSMKRHFEDCGMKKGDHAFDMLDEAIALLEKIGAGV